MCGRCSSLGTSRLALPVPVFLFLDDEYPVKSPTKILPDGRKNIPPVWKIAHQKFVRWDFFPTKLFYQIYTWVSCRSWELQGSHEATTLCSTNVQCQCLGHHEQQLYVHWWQHITYLILCTPKSTLKCWVCSKHSSRKTHHIMVWQRRNTQNCVTNYIRNYSRTATATSWVDWITFV